MKNIIRILLILVIFLPMTIFSACSPDLCKNVICGEFGICDEGECFCEEGYTKDENGSCRLRFRDILLGEWYNEDLCNMAGSLSDSLTVLEYDGDFNKLIVVGWMSQSDSITVDLSEFDYTIARQSPGNNNIFIEGTGVYDPFAETLEWSYTISDETNLPVVTDSCTAAWTR